MGAINAFSKMEGCNCTHCTPLGSALRGNAILRLLLTPKLQVPFMPLKARKLFLDELLLTMFGPKLETLIKFFTLSLLYHACPMHIGTNDVIRS